MATIDFGKFQTKVYDLYFALGDKRTRQQSRLLNQWYAQAGCGEISHDWAYRMKQCNEWHKEYRASAESNQKMIAFHSWPARNNLMIKIKCLIPCRFR